MSNDGFNRNAKGQFGRGNKGGGRAPRERERRYYSIAMGAVGFADWKVIILRAAADAKNGDSTARRWLSEILIGKPLQTVDLNAQVAHTETVALLQDLIALGDGEDE